MIDSIWHAVIKVAKEEDIIKTGVFVGGGKNLQRTLTRHHHTLKSSAQRRRKPYATPSKSTASLSTLVSTPLTIKSQPKIPLSAKRLHNKQQSTIRRAGSSTKLKKVILKFLKFIFIVKFYILLLLKKKTFILKNFFDLLLLIIKYLD